LAALRGELGIPEGAFVVGKTGYFRPEKGFRNFFKGIAKARPSIPGLKALALGHGTEFEACRDWCHRAGIEDCVVFAGKVKEVADYLALMDVACLVPGSNEGLSNAVLEKMAMGKPLVVTDVGGNAELVRNGGNGFVIPPDDPGRLAEAVVRLYRDPELARRMGEESRRRVAEEFPLEAVIRHHERLIASLVGKPGRGSGEDRPDTEVDLENASVTVANHEPGARSGWVMELRGNVRAPC